MSKTVLLCDENFQCLKATFSGNRGTVNFDGEKRAEVHVTANYRDIIARYFEGGIQELDYMLASDAAPTLERAVEELGVGQSEYWEPTDGNVGFMFSVILKLCRIFPTSRLMVV
jgi:hypothetical protein